MSHEDPRRLDMREARSLKMTETEASTQFTTLQSLIFPEKGICTERELYFNLEGPAYASSDQHIIQFDRGGLARFNTYFNLFNISKWRTHCDLKDLRLSLEGEGDFGISIILVRYNRSWERMDEIISLKEGEPSVFDLSHLIEMPGRSLVYFEVKARDAAVLTGASWQTAQPALRAPDMLVSITTFKREAAVRQSVERFRDFINTSPLRESIHLLVVDNGKSAELESDANVTVFENENLGGAGGFTRGLIEARAKGATHCLFMDDDASIHMQSLERTWAFLAYATDQRTCVAGALTNARHKWMLWENGAIFDQMCRGVHRDVDLRIPRRVYDVEFESTRRRTPHNFYAGWWYFAFSLDQVNYLPFPFFVRGDDVSFGLVHDFNPVTLPGVVTFQDEDFSSKESAQTLYLDLRSHLAHHIAVPHMEIGRWRSLLIALRFAARSLVIHHYGTVSAINLAFEDFLEGPGFFAENIDMSRRRADIKALMADETLEPSPEPLPPLTPRRADLGRWAAPAMKFTLNGHLIPFYRALGRHVVVQHDDRPNFFKMWGASRITFIDRDRNRSYTVTHSKRRAVEQGWRLVRNAIRYLRGYPTLKETWRAGYRDLTSETFWTKQLHLDSQPEEH